MGTIAQAERPAKDGVALSKMKANGNMLMGRMFLSESDASETDTDNDTFALPSCNGRNNIGVRGIRLRAPKMKPNGARNLDAYIKAVTIVFGNGQARRIQNIGERLIVTNQKGDGMMIRFRGHRCVRSISVLGEQYEVGPNRSNSVVNVIGVR